MQAKWHGYKRAIVSIPHRCLFQGDICSFAPATSQSTGRAFPYSFCKQLGIVSCGRPTNVLSGSSNEVLSQQFSRYNDDLGSHRSSCGTDVYKSHWELRRPYPNYTKRRSFASNHAFLASSSVPLTHSVRHYSSVNASVDRSQKSTSPGVSAVPDAARSVHEETSVDGVLEEEAGRLRSLGYESHRLDSGALLAQEMSGSNSHFDKRGRYLQQRRNARFKYKLRAQHKRQKWHHPYIRWENILSFMRNHSPAIRPNTTAFRLSGHPTDLGKLQSSLRGSPIETRQIVRFGKSFTMTASCSNADTEKLRQRLRRFRGVQTCDSLPRSDTYAEETAEIRRGDDMPDRPEQISRPEQLPFPERFHHRILLIIQSKNVPSALKQLRGLFEESEPRQRPIRFQSFKIAIEFFLRHSEFTTAQDLLSRSARFGLQPTTAMYNVFLHNCASNDSLYTFNLIVRKMVDEKIEINGSTWLALFTAMRSDSARARVLREMLRLELPSQDNVAHYIAGPFIEQGFGSYLDKGGSVTDYLAVLDKALGKNWPSPGVTRVLLDALVQRDMIACAMDVLKALEHQSGFQPNSQLLNVFITHYATQRDMKRAVEALSLFHRMWPSIQPDKATLERLWKLAWNSYSYNVVREIWNYACIHGETAKMRMHVFPSLELGLQIMLGIGSSQLAFSRKQGWQRTAGLFVVYKQDLWSQVVGSIEDSTGDTMKRATEIAQAIVNAEVDPVNWKPHPHPFAQAIHDAWQKDREWATSGFRKQLVQDSSLSMFEFQLPGIDRSAGAAEHAQCTMKDESK